MEESLKHGKDAVIAHLDASKVLQPGVGALDFPALAVAAQLAFVLEAAVADVLSVGNNQLRSHSFQSRPQRIGVIAPIGNDAAEMRARASPSAPRHPHLAERALRELALGDLRGRKLRSDGYAAAVDHHHALRTFPATCFADCRAPFFAVMKVASRKASSQSSKRRSSSRKAASATLPARRLVLPTSATDASTWTQLGTPRAHRAIGLQFAAPTESLPGTHGARPKGGLAHPCAASVPETVGTISPTAPRSTILAASSASWQKSNKPPASHVSPSFEAAPIYATGSSVSRGVQRSCTLARGP